MLNSCAGDNRTPTSSKGAPAGATETKATPPISSTLPATEASAPPASSGSSAAASSSTETAPSEGGRLPHISEYGELADLRLLALPDRYEYREGDKATVRVMLVSGSRLVACDYITYTVTADWGFTESETVSGEGGSFVIEVACKGSGELRLNASVCDAGGNAIPGVSFSGSVSVYPSSFCDWSEELKDQAPLIINGESYRMTFLDHFDGDALDKRKWSLCPEQLRQNTGYWRDSMISLDGGGNLIITAAIDENGKPISGGIRSKGRFEQARGYFEVRCRLQSAPGFWGAFWLMCDEQKQVGNGAVDGAEIDIFESNSVAGGAINHAVHWDGYGNDHRMVSTSVINKDLYDGEYHTFGLLWDERGYNFYIDGVLTWSCVEGVNGFPGSCEVPCYLKLSSEFGSWAGSFDFDTLPDTIAVDYVKVYERVPTAQE